jgi:hypothetical protein
VAVVVAVYLSMHRRNLTMRANFPIKSGLLGPRGANWQGALWVRAPHAQDESRLYDGVPLGAFGHTQPCDRGLDVGQGSSEASGWAAMMEPFPFC